MTEPHVQHMLQFVVTCGDAKKLRQIAKNAEEKGVHELARAARLKLYSILPGEEPGTIEYAVWQSIFALEDVLKQERGKTIMLSRTRQKIGREGVTQCVADLVLGSASEGYRMLSERGMLELSFEAIVLEFSEKFGLPVIEAAQKRLAASGFNPE